MAKFIHLIKGLFVLLLVYWVKSTSIDYNSNDEDPDTIDLSDYGETIFRMPDSEITGELVSLYNAEDSDLNPEELGTYLEGDILIPLNMENGESDMKRNGIITKSSRWPGGILPYEIRGTFTREELGIIEHAFQEYHAKTCIRFRPRTTERDYISFVNDKTGCWSSVGRLGGRQKINLQTPHCLRKYGTAIHEIMHALGFLHEQNRHERDGYVQVMSENIKPNMMPNFEKTNPKKAYGFGVEYDYASVMHYSASSFSRNGKPTLRALRQTPEANLMGQRKGFSASDVIKINAMYKCK